MARILYQRFTCMLDFRDDLFRYYEEISRNDMKTLDQPAENCQSQGDAVVKYSFPKFPDSMRKLLEVGGLAEYLKTL